jgi:molybdenum cofactor cytidylyltransferase
MMESPSHIAIVVLAAGASKRMGSPKQLLKWGDGTLIGNAIETVSKLASNELIVVLGAHYELIKNVIQTSPVTILNNENWEKGLGSTIAFAVEYLQNSKSNVDGVLITLCDQPLITADFLNLFISKFQSGKNQILATSYGNGKQGVPVLFDKVYFNDLEKLNSDEGAKEILKKYSSHVEALTPQMDNKDLDTSEEYTALYQTHFKA